jgi:uncharacterized protein YbjT (DUF2867 family)
MTAALQHQSQPHLRRVAIAGASGLVGQYILQSLLADDSVVQVHALGRRKLAKQHPKITEHLVDFRHLPAFPAVDELYLALGTTIRDAGSEAAFRAVDFAANLAVAEAATAAGARRVALVSAAGANAQSRNFYSRVKGELEEALSQLDTDALLVARPSLLLGDRATLQQPVRRAEHLAQTVFGRLGWLLPTGLRPVAAQSVANALVKKLPSLQGKAIVTSAEIHRSNA